MKQTHQTCWLIRQSTQHSQVLLQTLTLLTAPWKLRLSHLQNPPIKSIQTKDSTCATSPMMKNEITFSQSLSLSQDTPLSKDEEQLTTTHLVDTDRKKQTILCKTSGQPMSLQRVTIPRKNTHLVRTPTERKRAKLLQLSRTSVAGGLCSSTDTQLASELKRIPVDRRQDITKKPLQSNKSKYHAFMH